MAKYIEDRILALENAVAGLLQLANGSLDREQVDTQRELEKVLLDKKLLRAGKKKSVLERTLKKPKPVKRKRAAVSRL